MFFPLFFCASDSAGPRSALFPLLSRSFSPIRPKRTCSLLSAASPLAPRLPCPGGGRSTFPTVMVVERARGSPWAGSARGGEDVFFSSSSCSRKNVRKKLPLSETLRATLFPNPLFPNPFLLILGLVEPSPSREKERKSVGLSHFPPIFFNTGRFGFFSLRASSRRRRRCSRRRGCCSIRHRRCSWSWWRP